MQTLAFMSLLRTTSKWAPRAALQGGATALEIRIRMAGGSGGMMHGSAYGDTGILRTVAAAHIYHLGSVANCTIWGWLLFASRRAFRKTLPRTVSKAHKRWGCTVLLGL